MAYQVPLSYTVNVSLAAVPAGLADFNTNSIAVFTNETAGFTESYRSYITPSSVATDFGSNSLTYKMANALFTPVPNFRTGNGMLYIFPFKGVNATAGKFTTTDLTNNVANFKSISNGVLKLTIDGTVTQLEGLDFSNALTLDDIIGVLNAQALDIDIIKDENTIVFSSRKFGTDSGVTISSVSVTGMVDISGSTYLNATAGTTAAGTNASGDTLSSAVSTALEQVYFGGVLTTQYADNATILANSTAIQALDCDYFEVTQSLKNISVLGSSIKSAGNGKTRTLAYSLADAKVVAATYATIAKSVNRSASNAANTMNLKTLTGILPDTNLSDTYVLAAANNGVDIYGNTGGLGVVYSNDNNGYTDDIENQLWLKKAFEIAGFNYLRQTNTKIPQTEAAMAGLKNAYAQVCERGINNGVVAAGTWNSAIPFGDPEDFARNIEERGYYIYSLPIAKQAQTDREQRKAPVVQIALKFSGALHFSEVIVQIER